MKASRALALSVIAWSTMHAAPALADSGFGQNGQMVLSAERLFGLTFTKVSDEDGGGNGTQTESRTNVALFWPPLSVVTSPYQIPHLAFDFVVSSGISVGGSIGFVSSTGTSKAEPANGGVSVERDSPTITILAFAPRVGYALPLTQQFSFWPRAGITYYSIKSESTGAGMNPTTTKNTTSGLGVNLEPMFVFSPIPNFGISAGPVLDLPLSGTQSVERTPATMPNPADDKVKYTNYGIVFGLLGYF
jgi:hypothetical protein